MFIFNYILVDVLNEPDDINLRRYHLTIRKPQHMFLLPTMCRLNYKSRSCHRR